MDNFVSNKIQQNNELLAEELKQRREDRKIKIETVAKKLKINLKYLQALENGQLEKLPAGLYGKKILQEYSIFLNLDTDFLTKLWEMETENRQKNNQQNIFSYKVPKKSYFLTIPAIIKNLLILLSVFVCLFYLGFYIKNIVEAPKLEIYSPADNLSITQNFIFVTGLSEPETNVTINNEPVLLDQKGNFSQKINLSSDLNTISISAKKKYGKQITITRRILVKPDSGSQQ